MAATSKQVSADMDYGKAFTFAFEDRNWLGKILVGALFTLLSFILIGLPFVMGYFLEVVRRVSSGRADVLPEWDRLGDKFAEGLMVTIILIILAIPMILFSSLWSVLGPALDQAGPRMGLLLLLLMLGVIGLFLLFALLYTVVTPAVIMRYAMTRSFGAAFNPAAVYDIIRAHFGHYVLVLILSSVAGGIALFGVILCVIGVLATLFWAYLVQAHLYGQYYRHLVSAEPPASPVPAAA